MPGLAQSIRVVCTIGPVPPDVIVAASHVERSHRARLKRALQSMASDPSCKPLLADVFGTTDMRKGAQSQYEPLHVALRKAHANGVFDAAVVETLSHVPADAPTLRRL